MGVKAVKKTVLCLKWEPEKIRGEGRGKIQKYHIL
jgi:hypothetical protein